MPINQTIRDLATKLETNIYADPKSEWEKGYNSGMKDAAALISEDAEGTK